MGFRFRRTIRIMPGVRLNVGKRGVSASVGVRGAHVTIGKTGVRKTVGVPGTGMSWTSYEPHRVEHLEAPAYYPNMETHPARARSGVGRVVAIILAVGVVLFAIAHL